MIHLVGRSSLVVGKTRTTSGTPAPMIMKANDQRRTTNDAIPIRCNSPTVRPPVTYVQKYRDFELALGAARAVPSCCSQRPCSLAGLLRPLSSRRQRRIRDHFASEFQPDWVSPQVSCGCAKPGTTQRVLEKDYDNDKLSLRADRT